MIIIDKNESFDNQTVSDNEEVKDWFLDFGIVNKNNGRTLKAEKIFTFDENNSTGKRVVNKSTLKKIFYKSLIIDQIFKASGLSITIRKVLEDIVKHTYDDRDDRKDEYLEQKQDINDFNFSLKLSKLELLVFLKKESGILYQNDIRINYPKNWKKPKKVDLFLSFEQRQKRTSSTSRLIKNSGNILSSDSIFDMNWKVTAGESEIDKEKLALLIQEKRDFIYINDEYYELDLTKISRIINRLKMDEEKYAETGLTFYDTTDGIIKDEINIFEKLIDKKSKTVASSKSKKKMKINLDTKIRRAFNGTLRNYQVKGVEFLYNIEKFGFGSILADDMGLGKTIQIIALLLIKKSTKASLIIAPTTLLYNWESEIKKFAPNLSVHIHYGIDREKESLTELVKENDVILTSYGVIKRDSKLFLKKTFPRIIIDEAQNIKNPDSDQSKVIKLLKTKSKIALTGTPIENRLMELWSIMDFCNKGLLFSSKEFYSKFESPISKSKSEEKIALLKSVVTPFLIRRMKTDKNVINDLPEKQESKIYLPLTETQIALYDYELDKVKQELLDINGRNSSETNNSNRNRNKTGVMLATITKLKQICNHPDNYLKTNVIDFEKEYFSKLSYLKNIGSNSNSGKTLIKPVELLSSKLSRLIQMAKVIESEGRKLLIFTQYVEMGKIIQKSLEEVFSGINNNDELVNKVDKKVLFFHGSLSAKKRKEMIIQFDEEDKKESEPNKYPILILSLRAGGLGLNLTKANYVFHFDRWWNPAVENQAVDRVHRIGQKRNTFVYKFICKGTLEEKIDKLIDSKIELSNSILPSSGKSFVSEMDDKEFLELIKRN